MRQVLHGSVSTTAQSFEQRYRLRITRSATSIPTSPSCATKVATAPVCRCGRHLEARVRPHPRLL